MCGERARREIENLSALKVRGTENGKAKPKFVEKGEWPGFIQHVSARHSRWREKRNRVLLL